MKLIDAATVARETPWLELIDALAAAFRDGAEMPTRHHHDVHVPGDPDATLLLMPCWIPGETVGVKVANVFPGNSARGLPAVNGTYLLMDGRTGEMRAVLDGGELTARRTAAASALAARYLARADAATLLVVGTGRLAPLLAEAHRAVRPIGRVMIWGRNPDKAAAVAKGLDNAVAVDDLARAAGEADVISCATLSQAALIHGAWLKPGCHLDLVGAFKPDMREADDDALAAARVFVDTRAGALKEGGDLVQAMASGAIAEGNIVAELADLVRDTDPGRRDDREITVFKSVGAALEDLAAARLVAQRLGIGA